MKKFTNTDSNFGMSGPFEAESKEALADEMTETFVEWATQARAYDIDIAVSVMRKQFIAALVEVSR